MERRLSAVEQAWPLARPFVISRGAKYDAVVVVAEIEDGECAGRGECVPYGHYGETIDSVIAQISGQADAIAGGMDRPGLLDALPPGAARNALDCALWDLAAKQAGKRVWELLDMPAPAPAITAETIGIGTPDEMAARAKVLADAPMLKIKLDGAQVRDRMVEIKTAAPNARLVVDPNEGWDMARLRDLAPFLADLGVEMIEQPLPAGNDTGLADYTSPVPICADEACHTTKDLDRLVGLYDMVNIKLDKSGGLTEALALADAAQAKGFGLMVGCMVGTSLAMAPATLLMNRAKVIDLDGPLLLKEDRENGLSFKDGHIHPPTARLWG